MDLRIIAFANGSGKIIPLGQTKNPNMMLRALDNSLPDEYAFQIMSDEVYGSLTSSKVPLIHRTFPLRDLSRVSPDSHSAAGIAQRYEKAYAIPEDNEAFRMLSKSASGLEILTQSAELFDARGNLALIDPKIWKDKDEIEEERGSAEYTSGSGYFKLVYERRN